MISNDILTLDDCGCWLDGQRGHYIGRDTIRLAHSWGCPVDDVTLYLCDKYEVEYFSDRFPHEFFDGQVDRTFNWLNDNIAPEGASFEFDDGLYLVPIDDDC